MKKVRRGTQKADTLAYFSDGRVKTVLGLPFFISARNRVTELERDHGCTFEHHPNWAGKMMGYRYVGPWPQPLEG